MSNYRAKWQSPSNIAIVKYWGKYGNQLPRNPSISLTLKNAVSTTEMSLQSKTNKDRFDLEFYFEGQSKPEFAPKTIKLFEKIAGKYNWLEDYRIKIDSANTFPHSSGIASSASGMSALALCVADLDAQLRGEEFVLNEATRQEASYSARLGSGSACRSLYAEIGQWGKVDDRPNTSDEYAISWREETHEVFRSYHDDILIVSKAEKSVSSSAGHGLMDASVYAQARYRQANTRINRLFEVLKSGDVNEFGQIAEDEALTLHGLMMCSEPSFTLLEPDSIAIVNAIRHYRSQYKVPVYFTIDAGPNIHILYPDEYKSKVQSFIKSELLPFCADGRVIEDEVGEGPCKLD